MSFRNALTFILLPLALSTIFLLPLTSSRADESADSATVPEPEPEPELPPLILQANALSEKIQAAVGEIDQIKIEMEEMTKEELLLLKSQTDRRATDIFTDLSTFVALILKIEDDDTLDASTYRAQAEKLGERAVLAVHRQITNELTLIS